MINYLSDNPNLYFCSNLNDALKTAYDNVIDNNNVWVMGGAHIYNEALRHKDLNFIYHTLINETFDCDTFINDFDHILLNKYQFEDIDRKTNKTYNLSFNKYKIKDNAEVKYLKLLENIFNNGIKKEGRNGLTMSSFSEELKFDVSNSFPLLTTKKMFLRGIIEELLFFIRGETDTSKLSEKGIRIWEGNTDQNFLNKMGFDYKVGEMGPMYGYQWRFFNKPYGDTEGGIDQLKNLISDIKSNPNSRRLLMTDYNPSQVKEGVLYPCHSLILQFYVDNNNLSVKMYQRSADLFLGLPFNIASTTLLLYIIGKLTDKTPSTVTISLGDCHIYKEHFEQVKKQLNRTPYILPTLKIPDFKTLEDVELSTHEDYKLNNYSCYQELKHL